MLDFSWMTVSQTAALIIAIVLSVISVATTFLAFKYAKKINSFIKAVCMALILPFLAMASWLFLIFSFLDGFRKDEILNVIVSILVALFLCGVIIVVAKALYSKNKDVLEFEKDEPVDDAIEGSFEDQTNTLDTAPTLLLKDVEEEKLNDEEVKLLEQAQDEIIVDETLHEEDATEVSEEFDDLATDDVVEENVVEDDVVEEFDNDDAVVDETIDEVDENNDTEEVEQQDFVDSDNEDDFDLDDVDDGETDDTDSDDEDEEFEKFLETLRARNKKDSDDDNQDNE